MSKKPRAGDLRERIQIGIDRNTANVNGYPETQEVPLMTVWAAVTDSGKVLYTDSRYFSAGDTMNSEKSVSFVIRWNAQVKPGMWVKLRGRKMTVTGISEYDYRRNYMSLKAMSVDGVSG